MLAVHFHTFLESEADMKKDQFVVKHGNEWAVKGAGNQRATAVFDTKQAAVKRGKSIAQNQHSELRIQDNNGRFRVCNSYGNDSCPPKDKNY